MSHCAFFALALTPKKFGFIPIKRHESKQPKPALLKGSWLQTADKAKKKRQFTIDKWSTTSENLMKQNTFTNKRKESVSSTSEKPKQSPIPQVKVDALDKKWKGTGKDALKRARDTTLKWTNMSQELKTGSQKETPSHRDSQRNQAKLKLRRLMGKIVQMNKTAKLFNEGAARKDRGLLLPESSSGKVPVGFLPRKVQVEIIRLMFCMFFLHVRF